MLPKENSQKTYGEVNTLCLVVMVERAVGGQLRPAPVVNFSGEVLRFREEPKDPWAAVGFSVISSI